MPELVEESVLVTVVEEGGDRGARIEAETDRPLRRITARAFARDRREMARWWFDPRAWAALLRDHAGGAVDGLLARRFPVSTFDGGRRV